MPNYLIVKEGKENYKILFSDIDYLKVIGRYIRIITKERVYIIAASLNEAEELLSADMFCRINKTCIISFDRMTQFNAETLQYKEDEFPIGREYRETLSERFKILGGKRKKTDLSRKEMDELLDEKKRIEVKIVSIENF